MRLAAPLLALALLLAPLGAAAQISLSSIRNGLIEFALDQINSPGSFEITVEGIEDPEEGVTSLVGAKVSDGEGVWLTVERVNFAWNSRALLSGELAITRLELIGVDVTRPPSEDAKAPELKEAETERGIFDWPRSPLALSIEGVRLERVSIAEGVLPQAIRFDAEGRAFDQGDLQELALSLRRTDDVAGNISVEMRRDFAANTLKLDIEAREDAGGLVAAAAGLPDDAPARLTLAADGPPEDWRLTFDSGVERVFDADGAATLQYRERLAFQADFDVVPGPEMPQQIRTVLGDRASLVASVIEREDGMIEVVEGSLDSPALRLSATGALATTGAGESDLAVSLVALAPLADLVEGVSYDEFTFDGSVRGPQGGLVAQGALGLTDLRTAAADAGRLALDGRVEQTADGFTFDLGGEGSGLRIDRLGPEVIGEARLRGAGVLAGTLLTLRDAGIESDALTASASGAYDLEPATGEFVASFAAGDLAPVAAAYDVAAEGAVSAAATVAIAGERIDADVETVLSGFAMEDRAAAEELRLDGRVLVEGESIEFDLTGAGRAVSLDRIPRDLTARLDLTARGRLAGETLDLAVLRLESPLLTAGASGSLDLAETTAAIDYTLETAELSRVAAAYDVDASGALEARGRVEGPLSAPRLAGVLRLADAGYQGRGYGRIVLDHDVTVGAVQSGRIELTKTGGEYGDASLATRFRHEAPTLTLEALDAEALGAALSGDAAIDLERTLVDGALAFESADISRIGALAGVPLSGGVRGEATLTAADGAQNVDADVAFSSFATDGASVRSGDLSLSAADILGAVRLDARLNASGVNAGGVALSSLRATAAGPREAIDFTADARGELAGRPLAADLRGRADASGEIAEVNLASARVTLDEDAVSLRRPLALRIGAGVVEASGLDLALPEDGVLTGGAALGPEGASGDLALRGLRLSMLQRWAEVPITAGQLDARASFDTTGAARGDAAATIRGLEFEETQAGLGGLDIDLNSTWNGARLDSTAEIRGGFGDPVRARLALPVGVAAGGLPQLNRAGAIDGALTWAGRLGDLWALVPAPGHVLDGDVEIDLRAGGSLNAPRPAGRVTLRDGAYQNLDFGTILTDLTLDTVIAEDGDVRFELDARDGASGTVRARTTLRTGGGALSPETDVEIRQATLVRRDDVTAQVSGDLALRGDVANLALSGGIVIDRAEVRLVNATPPDVVDLEGIRIKGEPEEEGNGGAGGAVALDLTVRADRDIFVRGRGLDSEWAMNLTVRGFASAPRVTGSIERVRGQLDLLGRPFELARGRVVFDGGAEINPIIDVGLEREDHGIRGGIYVEGRASAPELKFASIPALPEEEVMPRLLFGRSKQSLSGAEAVQLATGIATLMSGRAGPLDFAREAAGVDVLRVEGESVDDASLTVGRNVGENVFVGARQKLGGAGTAVTVEVEVFEGVTVDTEIGQEGTGNVGITLRKDF